MYETREQRQTAYDQYATILAKLVAGAEEHHRNEPDCGAEPICIDGAVMERLCLLCSTIPDYSVLMISVAVNELSRTRQQKAAMQTRMDSLTKRLEIQRQIAADANLAYGEALDRLKTAEAETQELLGRIDELEHSSDGSRVIGP